MADSKRVKDLIDRDLSFVDMKGDIMYVNKGLVPNMQVSGWRFVADANLLFLIDSWQAIHRRDI